MTRVTLHRPPAQSVEGQEARKESVAIARDVAILKESIPRFVRVGMVAPFVPPYGAQSEGWVELNGQTIYARDYPEFFAGLGAQTFYVTPNIPALSGTTTYWLYAGKRT